MSETPDLVDLYNIALARIKELEERLAMTDKQAEASETPEVDAKIDNTLPSWRDAWYDMQELAKSLERRLRAAEEQHNERDRRDDEWMTSYNARLAEIKELEETLQFEREDKQRLDDICDGLCKRIKELEEQLEHAITVLNERESELEERLLAAEAVVKERDDDIRAISQEVEDGLARIKELEERLAQDHGVLTLERVIHERDAEREARKGLEEALRQIEQWSHAYPLDIFPEPDLPKAAEVLKANGLTLDSISAYSMRHVITEVGKMARAALGSSAGEGE